MSRPLSLSRVVAMAVLVVVASSCSSASPSTTPVTASSVPSTHPTAEEQIAAQSATRSFRAFIADAAVKVATALTTADEAAGAGNAPVAQSAAAAALLAYDQLRGQEGLVSTGADQAAPADPNGEIDATSLLTLERQLAAGGSGASLASTLDAQGPTFELLLAHRSLLPQDIALDAKRELAWVALVTPNALGPNPPVGERPEDVRAAAGAAAAAITAVRGIGLLVDPVTTAKASAGIAATQVLLAHAGSIKHVVGSTNATVASVGRLAGSLAGYGVIVQGYQ